MRRVRTYLKSEMAKFVVSQKAKFGYTDKTKLNGYAVKELEEKGSTIGCSELYAIFNDHFDREDTHRFWFDIQIGLYELKRGA